MRNTLVGVGDGIGKIADALGSTLAVMSMDSDFVEDRQFSSREWEPRTVAGGVHRGVKGFVSGVYGGVTGVVEQPIRGMHRSGVTGLVKGECIRVDRVEPVPDLPVHIVLQE